LPPTLAKDTLHPSRAMAATVALGFAIAQSIASQIVTLKMPAIGLADGILLIMKGQLLQSGAARVWHYVEFNLLPIFLSLFDLSVFTEPKLSTEPALAPIYFGQTWVLAGSSAVLIYACASRLGMAVAFIVGLLLLSPLVIMWPSLILTQTLMLSTLFLLLAACIAYDVAPSPTNLAAVAIGGCLAIWSRDQLIYLVAAFVALLGINVLAIRMRRPMRHGWMALALLTAVLGFAALRSNLLPIGERYGQVLANVIQMRFLTDPGAQGLSH
jgi:hypothetical protein